MRLLLLDVCMSIDCFVQSISLQADGGSDALASRMLCVRHCCAVASCCWLKGKHGAMSGSEAEVQVVKMEDIALGRCSTTCMP